MNRWVNRVLVVAWLLIFPYAFAFVWLNTPALWFINLPKPAWVFLVKFFNIDCCEGGADLEIVVGLCFGLIFALLLLGLFFWFRGFLRSKQLTLCNFHIPQGRNADDKQHTFTHVKVKRIKQVTNAKSHQKSNANALPFGLIRKLFKKQSKVSQVNQQTRQTDL